MNGFEKHVQTEKEFKRAERRKEWLRQLKENCPVILKGVLNIIGCIVIVIWLAVIIYLLT